MIPLGTIWAILIVAGFFMIVSERSRRITLIGMAIWGISLIILVYFGIFNYEFYDSIRLEYGL